MLRLYRVTGASMEPTLSAGDIIVLRSRPARTGDLVVVRHPRKGRMIKRLRQDGLLEGDSPDSTEAERLGPYAACEPIGVAVLSITPAGLRRLSARSETHAGA